ncbi:MAG: hypothetical protein LBI26_03650 [Holosporales bacterium]|jgi:hypothetical protein|nr:hypothetical protein [Holosporales bacterium]
MKNMQFILKIEKEKELLLSSIDANIEFYSASDFKITRNINNEKIDFPGEIDGIKYRCFIETNDFPAINLLKIGEVYEIYSTIPFRQKNGVEISRKHIPNSLEKIEGGYVMFRPILKMYLINYQSNNFGKFSWNFEFEEI